MSARPPFPGLNNISISANNPHFTNINSISHMNANLPVVHNVCTPRTFEMNKFPRHNTFGNNDLFNRECISNSHTSNISYRYPCSANSNPDQISAQLPIPVSNYYPSQPVHHPTEQSYNPLINSFQRNTGVTTNNDQRNELSYPPQNIAYSNLPGIVNNANDISRSFQNSLPTDRNITPFPESRNNSIMMHGNAGPMHIVPSTFHPELQNCRPFSFPPPGFQRDSCTPLLNNLQDNCCKEEIKLQEFLAKFSHSEQKTRSQMTVPEFRSILIAAFSLLKLLFESKYKLSNLTEADEKEWNAELQSASNLKKQLSEICSLISAPVYLSVVMKNLKHIKKKRVLKKKTKLNQLSEKIKREQSRKERHQEIDKYLDDIKEKNAKLKREVEMKKEADYILSEVRKKIHEAKRTIEKIKVFEKLRNARQANAAQKGLHVLPDHNKKFEKKVVRLKETMLKQLEDYEAEERALKVMLETEQEGQLEEEAQWKLKKLRTLQQIRKNNIVECLFGNSEDPVPSDDLFLFHKYHTSANNSAENLVQIRHQWDIYVSEDGETIPQPWVVPVAPNSSSWEQWLTTSKH